MVPPRHLAAAAVAVASLVAEQVALAARLSTDLQAILPGGLKEAIAAAGVVREVPLMVSMVRAIPPAPAAMEHRSLESLAFPHIWDRIPSAAAVAAAEISVGVLEALAAAAGRE